MTGKKEIEKEEGVSDASSELKSQIEDMEEESSDSDASGSRGVT